MAVSTAMEHIKSIIMEVSTIPYHTIPYHAIPDHMRTRTRIRTLASAHSHLVAWRGVSWLYHVAVLASCIRALINGLSRQSHCQSPIQLATCQSNSTATHPILSHPIVSHLNPMPVSPNVVDRSCHMALISPCGAGRVLVSPPTTSQALRAKEAGSLSPEEANVPSAATVLKPLGQQVGRLTVDALQVSDDLAAKVANIMALGHASLAVTQATAIPGCSSFGASQAQGLALLDAKKLNYALPLTENSKPRVCSVLPQAPARHHSSRQGRYNNPRYTTTTATTLPSNRRSRRRSRR